MEELMEEEMRDLLLDEKEIKVLDVVMEEDGIKVGGE